MYQIVRRSPIYRAKQTVAREPVKLSLPYHLLCALLCMTTCFCDLNLCANFKFVVGLAHRSALAGVTRTPFISLTRSIVR
jgi:hypothetical protein